jgi:mono/diheme cytochrome c family protein
MKRVAAALFCLAAAACDQNMDVQPKYSEYKPAPLFENGRVLQAPVPGTLARGDLEREAQAARKPALTAELLANGREKFDAFCSPCHGRVGDGEGMIVKRGMPHPPSFHIERLRGETDQHFFNVITKGYGAMYSHAVQVPPADRWAIIAYIRALQFSQHAGLDDVPADARARLEQAEGR